MFYLTYLVSLALELLTLANIYDIPMYYMIAVFSKTNQFFVFTHQK